MNTQFKIFIIALFTLVLTACSGGGGTNTSVTSFELLDPTPTANNRFGEKVVILPNGNIVVSAPNDSSVASSSGAVHLYNPYTQKLIASLYGDTAGDRLGSDGITALANNNFVVASQYDDEGGIANAGTVRLVSGTTGAQIGILAGDVAGDQLGNNGITVLANDNFVFVSSYDNEGGIASAGSVRLVSGTTGAQIGILAGDVADDFLGVSVVTALANNNFVVASQYDDEGGIVDAGSVRLVDGTTGTQIGSTLAGDVAFDRLGASSITALSNNNFVVASQNDVEGGISKAGSVRLVNGTTGAQIGSTLAGDVAFDNLGSDGITALANNNFVIASSLDDENSVFDAGSVRLVDGTTGVQIGSTLAGDVVSDQLGFSSIAALANNNFVIASQNDDENSRVDAGSVRLIDGTTGAQIGSTLTGDVAYDKLGMTSITALANDNFVVVSQYDDEGGINNAGSVRLVSGTTGTQIGSTLAGDVASDRLGNAGITALANSNFVVASYQDDENSIVDAGSIRQMDGETGNQIRTIVGSAVGDISSWDQVIELSSGDFYILSLPYKDHNAIVDSGFVTLIATQ